MHSSETRHFVGIQRGENDCRARIRFIVWLTHGRLHITKNWNKWIPNSVIRSTWVRVRSFLSLFAPFSSSDPCLMTHRIMQIMLEKLSRNRCLNMQLFQILWHFFSLIFFFFFSSLDLIFHRMNSTPEYLLFISLSLYLSILFIHIEWIEHYLLFAWKHYHHIFNWHELSKCKMKYNILPLKWTERAAK